MNDGKTGAQSKNYFELYPEIKDKSSISKLEMQGLSKSFYPIAVFDVSTKDKSRGDKGRKDI